jgi:hypothetical protein
LLYLSAIPTACHKAYAKARFSTASLPRTTVYLSASSLVFQCPVLAASGLFSG